MANTRSVAQVALCLTLLCSLAAFAFGANGSGWKISLTNPVTGTQAYNPGAIIAVYSGTFSWPSNDDAINDVAMYSLTGSANPMAGTIIVNTYATTTIQRNQDGSGSGTFNGKGVYPPLTAPTTKDTAFDITAVPENASSGWYITAPGVPLYEDARESTAK